MVVEITGAFALIALSDLRFLTLFHVYIVS